MMHGLWRRHLRSLSSKARNIMLLVSGHCACTSLATLVAKTLINPHFQGFLWHQIIWYRVRLTGDLVTKLQTPLSWHEPTNIVLYIAYIYIYVYSDQQVLPNICETSDNPGGKEFPDAEIHVFERDRVGGRARVFQHAGHSYEVW